MSLHDKVITRWAPAYGFLEAADVLASKDRHKDSDILSVPIYLLLGYHVELMLKAYLTAVGLSDKDLKDVGHNLSYALKIAKDKGLTSAQPIDDIVSKMSAPHQTHAFRYFDDAEIDIHTIDSLIPALKEWANEVHDQLEKICPPDPAPA